MGHSLAATAGLAVINATLQRDLLSTVRQLLAPPFIMSDVQIDELVELSNRCVLNFYT